MYYKIEFAPRVKDHVKKIGRTWFLRIMESINSKLGTEPEKFGKPLRKSLRGYRRLRVGDYRVIFKIEEEKVKILAIGHRSIVYRSIDL